MFRAAEGGIAAIAAAVIIIALSTSGWRWRMCV